MSLSRGSYNTNVQPTTFTATRQTSPSFLDILSGRYQSQGMQQQAAVGGSLQGVPLAQGPSSVTNSLVFGGGGPRNPQIQPGGYGYNAMNIAARPNTQMPQSFLPYSTLAATPPSLLAGITPTAPAGPVNQYGEPINIITDAYGRQRGSAGFGQYTSQTGNAVDARNLRIDPKWAQLESDAAAYRAATASAPSYVTPFANQVASNNLTWRVYS